MIFSSRSTLSFELPYICYFVIAIEPCPHPAAFPGSVLYIYILFFILQDRQLFSLTLYNSQKAIEKVGSEEKFFSKKLRLPRQPQNTKYFKIRFQLYTKDKNLSLSIISITFLPTSVLHSKVTISIPIQMKITYFAPPINAPPSLLSP